MIDRDLIQFLRRHFQLDWGGVHGAPHWARVRQNGLAIAAMNGANENVVEYFAFLHDACRESDGYDPGHGLRAARLAMKLPRGLLPVRGEELELLVRACHGHSNGCLTEDLTVQTCWDADRLDLPRVGIQPDPTRLCTKAARKLFRSRNL